MSRSRHPGLPKSFTGGKSVCPLCWKRPDKRDRTNNGYHIECAKQADEIILDQMHSGNGLVFRQWYASRYPGRPIPVRPQLENEPTNGE